jgi:hypothetical protein
MRKLRPWLFVGAGGAAALLFGVLGAQLQPGAALVLLTLGGVALAFCGMTLYRVLEPLLRPGKAAARAAESRESVRLRELVHEKQLVLKAIREIEHDYHMRKISEPDYKDMSQRYRARAMRLIREIDAGDDFRGLIEQELKTRLAAQDAAARLGCPGCGTINDEDAKFCKKCGRALGPAPAASPSAGGTDPS